MTPRRIEPAGGFTAAVMSVCQPDQGVDIIESIGISGAIFGDRVDLRILINMPEYSVADRALSELPGHRDVLRMVEVLAAEEHHLPFQQSVPDGFELACGSGLRSTLPISAPICSVSGRQRCH
ncbi:MAG: hypothetical protein U1E60_03810 [Reyranellaceae bacterium]